MSDPPEGDALNSDGVTQAQEATRPFETIGPYPKACWARA